MEEDNELQFKPSFGYKLIYVFMIPYPDHEGLLKIGEATIHTNKDYTEFAPNCSELNKAANERIQEYTKTASINYKLLYTEIAVRKMKDGKLKGFRDFNVRDVLVHSGFKRYKFKYDNQGTEWFKISLNQAIDAIKAVKEGRKSLNANELVDDFTPIVFRDEQEAAIKQTIDTFKKSDRILWNAKMRFGKTLCALEVAKREGYKSTLIMTHRPVVEDNWFEDFKKIFTNTDYDFGSKGLGKDIDYLKKSNKPFVYFASLQDLRGSKIVGGDFDKNENIFSIDWDMVVIDEAHEGTQTDLGQKTIDTIVNKDNGKHTKVISLSGTPFNLVSDYEEGEIYTWDYIAEQRAKKEWSLNHFGDSNPYEELPSLKMYVYDLDKSFPGYIDIEDSAFNFRKFFSVRSEDPKDNPRDMPPETKVGDFIYKKDVWAFLNLLSDPTKDNGFPFSTDEYISYFKHSLWIVPGVKEAKALSTLLSEHPVFGNKQFFTIVNVAGEGDEEKPFNDALQLVRDAIGDNFDDHHGTITLTCSSGRLTTGVTVPEWTAVFVLAGSCNTSPSSYLQTIFRVQNPANINGKMKDRCYVFDFAPDRTLKMVAEAANLSTRVGNVNNNSKKVMAEFLNFCPVISIQDSLMKEYDVSGMLQQLNRAYAERVVKNGFDDPHIYNDNLLKLDDMDLEDFKNLEAKIGRTKQTEKIKDIDITSLGFTDEEYEKLESAKKNKKNLTEEQKELLEEERERKKNKQNAISILRGISIRIPLMIYGADIPYDQEVNIDNFTDIIDDISWKEFMPDGVDKETFKKFSKYYEQDVFIAAGKKIRQQALVADEYYPTERVKKIGEIFMTFKNPDKETVLTPWRIVNMHLSSSLGGYKFFDADNRTSLSEPVYIDKGQITKDIFEKPDTKILEINSKSGLYPLYMTYSVYRKKIESLKIDESDLDKSWPIWKETVENNIYVICKTKMAKSITQRTLFGYHTEGKINAHAFDDLIMQVKEKSAQLVNKITRGSFWDKEDKNMEFDAVVGNPPYQLVIGKTEKQNQSNATYIYYHFQNLADKLGRYTSLIYPFGGWFDNPSSFNNFGYNLLNDSHTISISAYEGTTDRRAWYRTDKLPDPIFSNDANLSAGVSIVVRDMSKKVDSLQYSNRVYCDDAVEIKQDDVQYVCPNPLFVSINKKLGLPKLKDQIKKGIFSIESNFVELNSNKVSFNEYDWDNPILLYTNDKSGSSGRCTKYWTDRKNIPTGSEYFDYYKVVMTSAYPKKTIITGGATIENIQNRLHSLIEVLPPNSAFGRSRMALFMSNDESAVNNFIKYTQTKFFAGLVLQEPNRTSTIGSIIPSLDYSNHSDIDWSKSIDDINNQLQKKYHLSDDEILFIEKDN